MQLVLLAIGRMKAGPERELLGRYVDRAKALARPLGFSGFAVQEIEESRAIEPRARQQGEAQALLAALRPGTRLAVLDERGQTLASPDFAAAIGAARDAGGPAFALVVGGADGLDAMVRERADHVIAYGRATFPHQIVRILAAEQIYRALTILAGHPYHRN